MTSLSSPTWVSPPTLLRLTSGSKKGTRVNGKKVTKVPIKGGDIITLGQMNFFFSAEEDKKGLFSKRGNYAPPGILLEVRNLDKDYDESLESDEALL
jgi:pSer/pThr/pTyr-binding forkhead associated (FHA) protein